MNLYEILGVTPQCSSDALRQAYHRLLLQYHPDKANSNDMITRKRLEDIQIAFKTLSDADRRLKYDQEQERLRLHALPHTNIDLNDLDDTDEYTCRCGTVLQIDKEVDSDIIECPNCSMKVEITNK